MTSFIDGMLIPLPIKLVCALYKYVGSNALSYRVYSTWKNSSWGKPEGYSKFIVSRSKEFTWTSANCSFKDFLFTSIRPQAVLDIMGGMTVREPSAFFNGMNAEVETML